MPSKKPHVEKHAGDRCAAAITVGYNDQCMHVGRSQWATFGGRRIWLCGTHVRTLKSRGLYLWNDVRTLVTTNNAERITV